jgi:hypothetical protein
MAGRLRREQPTSPPARRGSCWMEATTRATAVRPSTALARNRSRPASTRCPPLAKLGEVGSSRPEPCNRRSTGIAAPSESPQTVRFRRSQALAPERSGQRSRRPRGRLYPRDGESSVHRDDVDAAGGRVVEFVQLTAGETDRSSRPALPRLTRKSYVCATSSSPAPAARAEREPPRRRRKPRARTFVRARGLLSVADGLCFLDHDRRAG